MTDQNKPFLRALKCAYKLHKAGLDQHETVSYLLECLGREALPSAATPPADLLPATFNFHETIKGEEFWHEVQHRLFTPIKGAGA